MQCPLVQPQAASNVHVSVCNGGAAELHEMEGAHQTDVRLLDLIAIIDDGGRAGQMGNLSGNAGLDF